MGRFRGQFFALFFAVTTFLTGSGTAIADQNASRMLSDTCIVCHGQGGSSQGPAIPSLATMTSNYIIGAMLAYKYDDAPEKLKAVLERITKNKPYEDLEAYPRFGTIMNRIAKGYSDAEIIAIGQSFSQATLESQPQEFSPTKAALGARLHEEFCSRCHENEGRSTDGDVGLLAGQWMLYLEATLQDYLAGRRDMPKKMKSKLNLLTEQYGDRGIEALTHYYGSLNDSK